MTINKEMNHEVDEAIPISATRSGFSMPPPKIAQPLASVLQASSSTLHENVKKIHVLEKCNAKI